MHSFAFSSYGVTFRVESNRKGTLERARKVASKYLVGHHTDFDPDDADHVFSIRVDKGKKYLVLDGEDLGETESSVGSDHYFGTRVRLLVAANSTEFVFLHSGVVGWKGKCVLFPADSHEGKTTLVAEMIKRGAVYYSDDYAVIDKNGLVHAYPRKLSIRDRRISGKWSDLSASAFGALTGSEPLTVGAVLITRYKENARWKPKLLTNGVGLLEMVPFIISLQNNPKGSLAIMKNAVSRAIIYRTPRPDIEFCVNDIIKIIDKSVC